MAGFRGEVQRHVIYSGCKMSGSQPFVASVQEKSPENLPWRVFCLCAEWCGVCRQYQSDFESLAAQFPLLKFEWVDVEAHEDVMGDLDIETFPTLQIGRAHV